MKSNDLNKGKTYDKPRDERLQKVLAQAGVASRRHAEQLILEGRVTVNGEKVTVLGTKVGDQDHIFVNGKPIMRQETFSYYLLNKPVGVITSAKDPQGRPTVVDIFKNVPVRVYPVGRLDFDTSGLLLLTNDGELAHRLMHPRYGVNKTYQVWVRGPVDPRAIDALQHGVLLKDGKTAPAKVKQAPGGLKDDRLEVLEITIHEGRNRQIRRMCEAVGYPVMKLERIQFGPLQQDKKLRSGEYRTLTAKEVKALRSAVGLEG